MRPPLRHGLLVVLGPLMALEMAAASCEPSGGQTPPGQASTQLPIRVPPDQGLRLEPQTDGRVLGHRFTTNRHGFRDYDWPERSELYRIVALGDSVTFGWGIAEHADYLDRAHARLEEEVDDPERVELLNLGLPMLNTRDELALLREVADEAQPDLVLLGWFINDAELAPRFVTTPPATGPLLETLQASAIVRQLTASIGEWRTLRRANRYFAELYLDDAPGKRAMMDALVAMRDFCGTRDIELLVVLLPVPVDYDSSPAVEVAHRAVSVFLHDNGIATVDVVAALGERDLSALRVSPSDWHPNAELHDAIGEVLAAHLRRMPALADAEEEP